ncbi:MAG: hypothetical protein HZB76_00350 [Chlamydiae bacterium]|nr:hypothetical protein [Chlamydiota bacterium]
MNNFKENFLLKLKELDRLNLSKKDYAITGSGPLAIRNLREANDVDILVTKAYFNELSKKYPPYDAKHIKIGNIEIWGDFINLTPKMEMVIKHSEIIEGYPFVTLQDTLSWKRFLNREKDQKDILMILAYIDN